MEESTFWEKLAKHLSSNEDADSSSFRNYLIEGTDPEIKRAVREASMIFGKSEKEVQDKFKQLDKKLRK